MPNVLSPRDLVSRPDCTIIIKILCLIASMQINSTFEIAPNCKGEVQKPKWQSGSSSCVSEMLDL